MSPSDGTTPVPSSPSTRSPLFEAQQAPRYERQRLICEYQEANACRLVVLKDYIFAHNIAPFEDTLFDANPDEDLHLMLDTLGGDGEMELSRFHGRLVSVVDRLRFFSFQPLSGARERSFACAAGAPQAAWFLS